MLSCFDSKLIKFIIVGVINTLVGTAIMFGLYNLAGFSYWLSSATNYVLTSVLSFFLNKYFTFQNREKSFLQVLKFALNILVCYLLAYGIAKPLIAFLLQNINATLKDNISLAFGMVLFTGFNYLGQRLFAFKEQKPDLDNEKL
jgi:putative flippase GtrA